MSMNETIYEVQQAVRGNWETLPEGEFASEEEALDALGQVEHELDWRNLRVVANNNGGIEVILYGMTA